MKRIIGGLAVAATLTALVLGSAAAVSASSTAVHRTHSDRQQAVRKAKEYLSFEAFSLKGLTSQLRFDGFSKSDARYGASHAGANWFKEAAKKAKEYLKIEAFSYNGMVKQLEFDGFTRAQARYGARAAGL